MLRRYFAFFMLSFALLTFSPAQGGMSISASSSLDTFSYDLDNIHLQLEKLDTRWQLSASGDGKLLVDYLRAKRLIITIHDDKDKSGDGGLPNRIKLPFPIKIQRAEVTEVVIITSSSRRTFNNVQFYFEGDAKTLRLDQLHASTPWGNVDVSIQLGTVNPFQLTGTVALANPGGKMAYDIKALLSGDLKTLHFDSSVMLTQQDGQLAILQENSKKTRPVAHISANGKLGLAKDYPLTVNAHITEIHPEQLGNYPAAALNFDLDLQGNLLPEPVINLQFTSRNSQWQGQSLSSLGKILVEGSKIRNIDFQAGLAANTIKANGSLGSADSRLEWQADLPDLAAFGAGFSGEAHAGGLLAGTFENLALRFSLLAQKLSLPGGLKAEKLEGQAMVMSEDNGKLEGEFKASGLRYGQHPPFDGRMALQGTRANHQLVLVAHGKETAFESTLQGGLTGTNRWQGLLQSLAYKGITPITLKAPAPLSVDGNGVTLEKAALQLAKGRALIDLLQFGSGGRLTSKGSLGQLTLEDFPPGLLALPSTLQGNLVFSGKWDLDAGENLNGSLSFWREAGDLTLTTPDGKTKPLGLEEVKAEVAIVNNDAVFTANFNGHGLGSLKTRIATTLTKTGSGYSLLASAPLNLSGAAQLRTLAWLPLPPSLMDASLDGQLTISVEANGTLRTPNLRGNVMGKNLQFTLPSEGVAFSDGTLEANFENDRLLIKQASWQGGEGRLRASGLLLMEDGRPRVDLDWTADKFTATSRTDRLLILGGSGKTTLAEGMLSISGNFTVIKGLIELASEDVPVLGNDVVVLGQLESIPEPALKVLLNGLRIGLGDAFTLRGHGLDAQLTGTLTLNGLTQSRPHTEGGIQVKKGTYMAYGQLLNIERGILNFSGPVDNPGLNIRAMRNSKPVNAGIEITGSAFLPVTKLVSEPNVPDSEKLSWLVLGHGLDQAGKNDYAMLSLAAGVLLSQGQSVPLQTRIARAAGLDEVSFSGSGAESASLTFGKRLSSKLYLSYEKSIKGLLDVARLTYIITPRWSLRAEAGTASAVDVLYTFSFK